MKQGEGPWVKCLNWALLVLVLGGLRLMDRLVDKLLSKNGA